MRAGEYTDRVVNFGEFAALVNSLAAALPEAAIFLEIGTRRGGTAMAMLNAVHRSEQRNRWVWSVDPYGDRLYRSGKQTLYAGYSEGFYREAMVDLYGAAAALDLNYCHWRLTSEAFRAMLGSDWFEFDCARQSVMPVFGFVSLDGEHTIPAVLDEVRCFMPRLAPGGAILIDDLQRIHPEATLLWPFGKVGQNSLLLTMEDER